MTAQAHNPFISCVVVVEFAVNGNQALEYPRFLCGGITRNKKPSQAHLLASQVAITRDVGLWRGKEKKW